MCIDVAVYLTFLVPGLPCVSALWIASELRGPTSRKVMIGLLAAPVVILVFFLTAAGLIALFVEPGACPIWPEVLGSLAALGVPMFIIRREHLRRETVTLSDDLKDVINRTFIGARGARHAIVTPEHLALVMIAEPELARYLDECGADLAAVEARLRACLESIETLPDGQLDTVAAPEFQHLMDAAKLRTANDHREYVMIRDAFLALVDERSTLASSAILENTPDAAAFEVLRIFRSDEEQKGTVA